MGEARQISDPQMVLVCDMRHRLDAMLFPYSPECSSSRPYNIAYNLINITGGTLALTHLSFVLAKLVYAVLFALSGSVFLVRPHLLELSWVTSSVASSFVYQHLVYTVILCGASGQFCAHLPASHWVLIRVFRSLVACGTLFVALKACFVAGFYAMFACFHARTWRHIMALETSILLDGRLQEAFEAEGGARGTGMVRSVYDLQDFVPRWTQKNADEMFDSLPPRAAYVMRALLGRDAPAGEVLSHAGFERFALEHGLQDPHLLWHMLTYRGEYDAISHASLEDALCDLFFYRKKLACAVSTDLSVLFYAYTYLAMALVPGAAIVVSNIFGYDDAFGTGIDLFKTYAVILSYWFSCISGNLQFLFLMALQRPFDIGDMLLYRGEVYEVHSFDASHTSLVGGTSCVLSNPMLLDGAVNNLTKISPSDSFELHLPLNSGFDVGSMGGAIGDYMRLHPRDVEPGSVRYGWVGVGADHKAIRWNWRYRFSVMGRSRLNAARTRIVSFLVSRCNADVVRSAFVLNVAAGGGLNQDASIREHAGREWKTE